MKALITGKGGQLAWELVRAVPEQVQLTALDANELDITDKSAVIDLINTCDPQLVINAAAYTAVDKAESEKELAYAVNAHGARNLAEACKLKNISLLHVSTDFVFDGSSSEPYKTNAEANPLSVYGASKLAGEQAVREILPNSSVIVRTAWVYSSHGNNFVKTMLRLMAERPELGVVFDQIGSPTWAKGLAQWLWKVASIRGLSGTFHWTDAGVASWYDFAVAIQELALEKRLLTKEIPVRPIPSKNYPTPAKRPAYSVLDKSSAEEVASMDSIHWRKQLSLMLDEL